MKRFPLLMFLATLVSFVTISCDETSEPDEYANWKERNQFYIDSIAEVADLNVDGSWLTLKSYKLPADDPSDLTSKRDNNDYIYCQILQEGTGETSPIYTDSVRVHYRGWFINGELLDQSYNGDFDVATCVPVDFALTGVITGWTTVLQHMKAGDVWKVHIPYTQAYGKYETSGVKGYSSLVYWINLVEHSSLGEPMPEWQ